MRRLTIIAGFLCAVFGGMAPSAAQAASKQVESPGVVLGGDITLSGARRSVLAMAGSVVISDATMGNLAAAGGSVQMIGGTVGRLAMVGGTVELEGGHADDLYAMAGNLKVNGRVTNDMYGMAGAAVLTSAAVVGGNVDLTAGDIAMGGTIAKNFTARADHIAVAGTINGNAHLTGLDIVIAPGTHIGGDLVYTAPDEIQLPPDVLIGGKIVRHMEDLHTTPPPHAGVRFHMGWIVGFGGLLLCGVILLWGLPHVLASAEITLVRALPGSILAGVILACAMPVAVTVLMITIIGIPLALLLLAMALAIMGVGLLAVCRWIGGALHKRIGHGDSPTGLAGLAWAIGGFVTFLIVGLIPGLGPLAQWVAIVAGSGAVILSLWQRRPGATALVMGKEQNVFP